MNDEILLNYVIESANNKNNFITNIKPLIRNKEIFNISFYIFILLGILSKSKFIIVPATCLCCCKLLKIYKNNKQNINNLMEYVI